MLIPFLIQSQDIFEKPVLGKGEILVYAFRAELSNSVLRVTAQHQLIYGAEHRRPDQHANLGANRRLTTQEWTDLSKLLTEVEWKRRSFKRKDHPMWPSAYDGADTLIIAKIGKTTQVWRNRDFEGSGSYAIESWCDQFLKSNSGN